MNDPVHPTCQLCGADEPGYIKTITVGKVPNKTQVCVACAYELYLWIQNDPKRFQALARELNKERDAD